MKKVNMEVQCNTMNRISPEGLDHEQEKRKHNPRA